MTLPTTIRLHALDGSLLLEVPLPDGFPEETESLVVMYQGRVFQRDGSGYMEEGEECFGYSMRSEPTSWFLNFVERKSFIFPGTHP